MADFPLYKTKNVKDLIPYARNSRTHTDEQINKVAASIKEFGFLNPVIVDGDNGIIAGHCRVMAASKLGMDEVPTIEASHLSEAQRRAYIIADNRLALDAGWDDEVLRIEFAELTELDFDLGLTGFESEEVAAINLEIDDIEEVDHFNETFNFSITCQDLTELALVQDALGATGKKIDASRLLGALK